MASIELYNDGKRKWICFGRDSERRDHVISTNEYMIVDNGKALLLDPGGVEIFPFVVSAVSREIDIKDIEGIFASHQDPDIISSLSLWLGLHKDVSVYCSWIWETFIAHFGGEQSLTPIPDEGMVIPLGSSRDIVAIPAHYLHSSGNFGIYDPVAKILFSGDVGAALLPPDKNDLFVENFEGHIQYMEGFHRRWMPSNRAKKGWIERVSALDIELMCPQHGAIFRGKDVNLFLEWFDGLEVGAA